MTEGKYFVEECDNFSSHIDHEIVGWFDELDAAKEFADKRASSAMNIHIYRVYESKENRDPFRFISNSDVNCVYEVKGKL